RAYLRDVYIVSRAQAKRAKNFLAAESVERDAGDVFDRLTQHDESEIRVDGLAGGRGLGLLAMDLLVNELLGAVARHEIDPSAFFNFRDPLVERPPRRQARAMRQQMAKRDRGLAVHAEVRKKARHSIVEAKFAVARQDHHRDRRRQRLG